MKSGWGIDNRYDIDLIGITNAYFHKIHWCRNFTVCGRLFVVRWG